jgi:NADPH:quinone reductase-like Zn-dependent oxidoreductase
MKAVLSPKKGPPEVLEFTEMPKPVPKPDEILVKIRYATVTQGDVKLRGMSRLVLRVLGALFGFKPMKVPGVEFAGDVEEVGDKVASFKKGDAVCGTTTGLRYGANAEYVSVPEHSKLGVITHKPEGVDYREAAALPVGFMTAIQLLKPGEIEEGERVLINGASGSVGSYAVQLAASAGAHVIGVCGPGNLELVASLGADEVVDYTKADFTVEGRNLHVIFDAVGKLSKSAVRNALAPNGRFSSVRMRTDERTELLDRGLELLAEGKINAVIDREYTLEEIVEAHRYVERGHKKGNVIIKMAE